MRKPSDLIKFYVTSKINPNSPTSLANKNTNSLHKRPDGENATWVHDNHALFCASCKHDPEQTKVVLGIVTSSKTQVVHGSVIQNNSISKLGFMNGHSLNHAENFIPYPIKDYDTHLSATRRYNQIKQSTKPDDIASNKKIDDTAIRRYSLYEKELQKKTDRQRHQENQNKNNTDPDN